MGGGNKAPTSVQVQRTAFIHNPKSKKTAHILSLPNEGLCYTCHETIEWRKRYRRYKPLTVAARCCRCGEKSVKRAYHEICDECAVDLGVCAKCQKVKEIIAERTDKKKEIEEQNQIRESLKYMTESDRRTFFRLAEKNDMSPAELKRKEKEQKKRERALAVKREMNSDDEDFDEDEFDDSDDDTQADKLKKLQISKDKKQDEPKKALVYVEYDEDEDDEEEEASEVLYKKLKEKYKLDQLKSQKTQIESDDDEEEDDEEVEEEEEEEEEDEEEEDEDEDEEDQDEEEDIDNYYEYLKMYNLLKFKKTLISSSLLTIGILSNGENKEKINNYFDSIRNKSSLVTYCLDAPTSDNNNKLGGSVIPDFPVWASTLMSGDCSKISPIEKRVAGQVASKELIAWKEQNLVPGVTACVMVRGFSDIENGIHVTEATKMRIASISKSLTSAAVGILVDDNKLDLDTPISQYEGDESKHRFPVNPHHPEKPLTARYLSSHLGGIRHYREPRGPTSEYFSVEKYETDDYSSSNNSARKKLKHPLEIFSTDPWVEPKEKSEPGHSFNYSTFGFTLLGTVIERIAKQDYVSFMKSRVFEKCGMNGISADYHDRIIPNRSKQYDLDCSGKSSQLLNAEFTNSSYKWAGGGFVATSKDICKFGTGLLAGYLVKRQTLDTMFTPQTLKSGKQTKYGIGWFITPNPIIPNPTDSLGDKVIYHTGAAVGGTTILVMLPVQGVVVSILANRQEIRDVTTIGIKIANIFSEHYQCT
ncbi:hypothetical protein PPL_01069 [Heterostelium album PN500]|uniref:Beta-lactamase-related domain-containing protein n=1 Tax=Heterostelium pallidum (strain ATCC 26659 / Pp 5 / PN500) TaxID=670386 RepID=D3AY11_HETP5|nr:hypothetical protein PPL_01069 [Heterostelium album PN500]EFA85838.1 hypothetical protein PPL_01069 [Heterostelium album PN500]|eukprot:XP_020437944.1 hypothetical protein PPL_01069 [Heterostelium album PN500]